MLLEGIHALLEPVQPDRCAVAEGPQVGGCGYVFTNGAADHVNHGFGLGFLESRFFQVLDRSVRVEYEGCQGTASLLPDLRRTFYAGVMCSAPGHCTGPARREQDARSEAQDLLIFWDGGYVGG